MSIDIRQAIEADFNQVGLIFADEIEFHANLLPDRYLIFPGNNPNGMY